MSEWSSAKWAKSPDVWCGTAVLVAVAGVANPWWVPTGDSEVYLTTARNLLAGRGLVFNGEPMAVAPVPPRHGRRRWLAPFAALAGAARDMPALARDGPRAPPLRCP